MEFFKIFFDRNHLVNLINVLTQKIRIETAISEINGKAKQTESGFTPQNEMLMDTAFNFVEDNDEQFWVNAFTLTDTTCSLSTCKCRLPTIA